MKQKQCLNFELILSLFAQFPMHLNVSKMTQARLHLTSTNPIQLLAQR